MFETEAEDKAFEKYPLSDRCDRIDLEKNLKYEEGFQDGAEFGYNKANEWHYVKDGDLPKESKKYYVYSEEWGVEVRKFIVDAGCFECRNNIIFAWKEIVLPKEMGDKE